ncbi:hypothetical protein TorRG33x02_102100 [Trema orientale]|uniref:Uncharacterized protein n=1 Tax=Trema orientale TaxID=63057 RepID=A0A2P5F8Q7_TREOI|nr:hypothetical protein TorRG33x02_102100 [Trema orientale]
MGLFLSCSCFSSSKTLPKEDHDHHQNGGLIRSVTEFVKPTHSRTGKNKQKTEQNENQYKKLNMVKKGTLEDLLLAEPGKKENCICKSTGKECCFVIRFFKRIYPPFEDCATKASKAKVKSASMERLLKVEVVDHSSAEIDVSSMSRSQSGNLRKRVSFRVPSEADIIIFYASDVDSED